MRVFADGSHPTTARALRSRVEEAAGLGPGPASPLELLVEWGVLEAAVLDALHPDVDDDSPLRARLRGLSHLAGEAFVRSWDGGDPGGPLRAFGIGLAHLGGLPDPLTERTPEGYAWYGLHPGTYALAARAFFADRRPDRVVCVGLRSIGTSLSAVVAATLAREGVTVESVAIRPHGHPFDRRPRLGPALAARLAVEAGRAWFLVVDEGPGLSGSSIVGAVREILALGVPEDRVALFPAHDPRPETLRSERARQDWRRFPRYCVPAERLVGSHLLGSLGPLALDFGGGAWRHHVCAPDRPRALPGYERRKLLFGGPDPVLARFAGIGRWGRETLRRAERLADAGFGPPVRGLLDGHLLLSFVDGRPVTGGVPDALVRHAAAYVAERARWSAERAADFDDLLDMVVTNTAEGLGGSWAARARALDRLEATVRDGAAVEIDGRLDPHEWLAVDGGFVKADGVDHCADHHLPGCTDVAWDVAGLVVELGADRATALAPFGADAPAVAARLPFYEAAYAAWRLGQAALALEVVGGDDLRAWRVARARWAACLRRALLATGSGA